MHAQTGCPAQTERALFTERRPKSSNQSCMRHTHTHTHTHTHYFSAHTQHQPLWRHHSGTKGTQTHTDAIADTHQGIQIIYLQYGTCIAGPRGVSRVRRRVRNSTALHLSSPSLLNCTQQKNANQQRDDVHLSRRLRRSIPSSAPSGISRRAPSLLMEFCSRPPEEDLLLSALICGRKMVRAGKRTGKKINKKTLRACFFLSLLVCFFFFHSSFVVFSLCRG